MHTEQYYNDLLSDMHTISSLTSDLYFKIKEETEQRIALNDLLEGLSEFDQEVLKMKYEHDASEKEIADHLKSSSEEVEEILEDALEYLSKGMTYNLNENKGGYDNEF